MKRFISLLICLLFSLSICGCAIATDYSAEYKDDGLYWKGKKYHETAGAYNEGNTVAKTSDKSWSVNEVIGDSSHTFVVVRSFLDQYLYVREDYNTPVSGNITAVYWDGDTKIENADFCLAIKSIIALKGEAFTFKTDNIYHDADTVDLCYENCPVGTSYVGLIGTINEKFVYIPTLPKDRNNVDGSRKEYEVTCYVIGDELANLVKQYVN